jgi:hypothetical protein
MRRSGFAACASLERDHASSVTLSAVELAGGPKTGHIVGFSARRQRRPATLCRSAALPAQTNQAARNYLLRLLDGTVFGGAVFARAIGARRLAVEVDLVGRIDLGGGVF